MKKRKISWVAAAVCFLLLLFGVTVSMLAAFRSSVRQVSRQEELEAESFGSYYALISEDDDTLLWNSVYEGAKAEGEENWDACVEFFGGRLVSERTTGEKLRMAIDAGVDGIILNGDGSPEVETLVKEARQKGIPVVTALNDGAEDIRQCFVGVNSYNLGKKYAERIWGLLQEIRSDCQIQVLLNSGDADSGKNTLFLGLRDSLEQRISQKEWPWQVEISATAVDGSDAFQTEEVIRQLMVEAAPQPKILVCLSEADTRRAYQAAVDYNRVGEVRILGYYESRQVLEGIDKEIIDSTITVDGEQVGSLCVQALGEYRKTGYVNGYLPVDTCLIDRENVSEYLERYPE